MLTRYLWMACFCTVFEATGFSPSDVDVCELHDCFSTNELLTYEGLGLCAEGEGQPMPSDLLFPNARPTTKGAMLILLCVVRPSQVVTLSTRATPHTAASAL